MTLLETTPPPSADTSAGTVRPARMSDAALRPVAERVVAGVPLNLADGMAVWGHAISFAGRNGQFHAPSAAWKRGVLQHQPPHQLLQHLHPVVQVLRVSPQARGGGGL